MPSATFSHTVEVDADTEAVWTALQETEIWSSLGPVQEVWDPSYGENGTLLGYRWATSIGGKRYEGSARTIEHERPERFVLDLDGGEMGGVIATNLSETSGGGTAIAVDLELRSQGMLSSLFFPAIRDVVGKGFEGQVDDLAGKITDG